VSIHSEHPFATPPERKVPLRRLRGRVPSPVFVVCTNEGSQPVGLTVSSVLFSEGESNSAVLLIDPESALGEQLHEGARLAMSQLVPGDQHLAEVFAGLAPAPGGAFTVGTWQQTEYGPRLAQRPYCAGTVVSRRALGWSEEVVVKLELVEVVDGPILAHFRGRYISLD